MRQVCIYHAGCPDGFGAAWAVWRAWGDAADYVARGHEDPLRADDYDGAVVAFVDIAPPLDALPRLGEVAAQLIVLDHHVTAATRFDAEPELKRALGIQGHRIHFDLSHSGAMLAWQHFHEDREAPDLLRYVEDQDLWRWKLPDSAEVNAAIASYPRHFAGWEQLAKTPVTELAAQGSSIARANRIEVERSLHNAHPISIGERRVEAVNALQHRSQIGHELASRAAFGVPCGAVYRLTGTRVDVSVYSIGDFDAAALATRFGGGGHKNAAGFSVPLTDWLARFL